MEFLRALIARFVLKKCPNPKPLSSACAVVAPAKGESCHRHRGRRREVRLQFCSDKSGAVQASVDGVTVTLSFFRDTLACDRLVLHNFPDDDAVRRVPCHRLVYDELEACISGPAVLALLCPRLRRVQLTFPAAFHTSLRLADVLQRIPNVEELALALNYFSDAPDWAHITCHWLAQRPRPLRRLTVYSPFVNLLSSQHTLLQLLLNFRVEIIWYNIHDTHANPNVTESLAQLLLPRFCLQTRFEQNKGYFSTTVNRKKKLYSADHTGSLVILH